MPVRGLATPKRPRRREKRQPREGRITRLRSKGIRRAFVAVAMAALAPATPGLASDHLVLDSVHFLIPGGAGGGWDGTARGTGEALTKSGLVGTASYENMSGGGGGKAIGYLIENAASNHGAPMVNSTPIVIRSLTGVFPQNFRDLTLVAGTIGDYAALVVHTQGQPDQHCERSRRRVPSRSPPNCDRRQVSSRRHGPPRGGHGHAGCR